MSVEMKCMWKMTGKENNGDYLIIMRVNTKSENGQVKGSELYCDG